MNSGAAFYESHGRKRMVRFGVPGMADILLLLPGGRFGAIEVKSSTGKATPAQSEFLNTVNKNGGLGLVAKDINDVVLAIQTHYASTSTMQKL